MNMPEILYHVQNGVGTITLNRPKALNALSLNMMRELWTLLSGWKNDPDVRVVVLESACEKAFCAGGDIRSIYEAGKAGNFEICDTLFRKEYEFNCLIRNYPKPYISLIHGIVMGGGVGISVNGRIRILSDKVMMAMPEVGIGFFPDVGSTKFLNDTPGKAGLYLAMTGARMTAADALYAGLGTHHIPQDQWSAFKIGLENKDIEILLAQYAQPLEGSQLAQEQAEIDLHFSWSSVEEIAASLKQGTSSFATATYAALKSKSPLSVKIAFHQLMTRDPQASFEDVMKREFRISQHLMHSPDFYEGVRAALIDKDQSPQWHFKNFEDISAAQVESFFQSLGEKELQF